MRDPKYFFLLIGALALVTISFIIISIRGYHYYFQNQDSKPVAIQLKQTPDPVAENNRDSLELILDSILRVSKDRQDSLIDSNTDSLDTILRLKIIEFRKLRSDIIEILNQKSALKNTTAVDEKMRLLQQNINELHERNGELESENEKLKGMVEELTASKNQRNDAGSIAQRSRQGSANSLPLLVSHLKFNAINITGSNKKATSHASNANELEGSFELNIKSTKNNSSKIFMVILGPGKKVLPNSSGKLGIFYSPDGNKKYSVVLRFDTVNDNHKRLYFSIPVHSPQPGKYAMQIYHGGILIGRLDKVLR